MLWGKRLHRHISILKMNIKGGFSHSAVFGLLYVYLSEGFRASRESFGADITILEAKKLSMCVLAKILYKLAFLLSGISK